MLSFSNITHYYSDKNILSNASIKIPKKKLTMVLGLSGAGKSTLLRLIGGRIPNDDIKLNDHQISSKKLKTNTAFVHQHHHLPGELTVNEYFIFCYTCRMPSTSSKNMQKIIDDILKNFDIFDLKNQIIGHLGCNLSGGQLKRIELGLELISDPELLFLDEPLSGLDSKNCLTILNYIKKMEKTIVTTVHQPSNTILNYFDHFIILHKRKIFFEGNYKELEKYVKKLGYKDPCENYCEFVFLRVFEDLKIKKTKIENFVYLKAISVDKTEVFTEHTNTSNNSNVFNQIKANLYRLVIQFYRNPSYGLTRFIISFLCAFATCWILRKFSDGLDINDDTESHFFYILVSLCILISITHLQASMAGFFVFSKDIYLVIKEQSNNYYSLFVYFISISLFEYFITVVIVILPYLCFFLFVPTQFRILIICLIMGSIPLVVLSITNIMIVSAEFIDPCIPMQSYIFFCAINLFYGFFPVETIPIFGFFLKVLNYINPIFQAISISFIPLQKKFPVIQKQIPYFNKSIPEFFLSPLGVFFWFFGTLIIEFGFCFLALQRKVKSIRDK